MEHQELIDALRRMQVETGSLACLGCGYEHNCCIHGCAIVRMAVEELRKAQKIKRERDALLEELRGKCAYCTNNTGRWGRSQGAYACPHLPKGVLATSGAKNCEHWRWRGQKGREEC